MQWLQTLRRSRRIPKRTSLLVVVFIIEVWIFILGLAALKTSVHDAASHGNAMLVIDTSLVNVDVEIYLNGTEGDIFSNIPDWYELYWLRVCHGMWRDSLDGTQIKDLDTVVCDKNHPGYNFNLTTALAAAAPPPAQPLFEGWTANLEVTTAAPFGLWIAATLLGAISAISYAWILMQDPLLEGRGSLIPFRIGYIGTISSVSIITNGASQITSQVHTVVSSAAHLSEVDIIAWTPRSFMVHTWLTSSLVYLALILSLVWAITCGPNLKRCQRARGRTFMELYSDVALNDMQVGGPNGAVEYGTSPVRGDGRSINSGETLCDADKAAVQVK